MIRLLFRAIAGLIGAAGFLLCAFIAWLLPFGSIEFANILPIGLVSTTCVTYALGIDIRIRRRGNGTPDSSPRGSPKTR